MDNYRSEFNNELYHYGVPGMKWGVHRFNGSNQASERMNGLIKKDGYQKMKRPGMVKSDGYSSMKKPGYAKTDGHSSQNTYGSSMAAAKARYKKAKATANTQWDKAADEYDRATSNGKVRSKKADHMFDQAADKWASDRNAAKAAYKKDKANIKKNAVKNYNKKYNIAERASNMADKKWHEVDAQYKALGKNRVTRLINAARNKSEAAKQYSRDYETASRMSDAADAKWASAKSAYKNTGGNAISRVVNNIKYDPNRRKR